MGYIISTVNMKGGVGKTTLTVNLAACLAKYHDKRVLIVDLDTQISATLSMMSPSDFAKLRRDQRTLRQLVKTAINPAAQAAYPIQDIIIPYACNVPKLHLLPGDIDMYDEFSVSEMIYEKAVYREQVSFETVWNRFERVLIDSILKPVIAEYDYIILDCAPGYNLLTRSALTASDFYLLPARPEPLSLIGIQLLERRLVKLREVHQDENPLDIEMLGIVFTMAGGFIGRYYRQVMNRVRTDYSEAKLFRTRIPSDVNVSKAVDSYLPVAIAHPNSRGSKAFQKLTDELLDKLQTTISRKHQQSSVQMSDL
ncbi:ParA family protein [Roseofilum sp. BLCC_M91]|uniref:ParA family protein n=1 Tax=Roseofilum halophilum BLCC-M91 TaxID=3022259 RepID=A0ABT7BL90_9CYAN|nr:ParA family protein [Roseofilum halophilum]MDJ1179241.1 ParA family protein [Roseofilum halophilum BLCC-M91]